MRTVSPITTPTARGGPVASRTRRVTPESIVMAQVRDYLIHHRILAFRMQTGAHVAQYKGRTRMVRYGTPGMGDWLTFPRAIVTTAPKGDPLGRGPCTQY